MARSTVPVEWSALLETVRHAHADEALARSALHAVRARYRPPDLHPWPTAAGRLGVWHGWLCSRQGEQYQVESHAYWVAPTMQLVLVHSHWQSPAATGDYYSLWQQTARGWVSTTRGSPVARQALAALYAR